jgi:NADP-dependent aldehyde dehydrogenase
LLTEPERTFIMTAVAGVDPRTATPLPQVAEASTREQVDRLARAAAAAADALEAVGRRNRADLLDTLADAVENRRAELVDIASWETGFGDAKLNGELTRACYQLRFFGDVLREGSYLEATIDQAADTPMGPRPDLRRLLVPIGPVAVFGASNFPFAFSVLGGDTASALAAGSPVIVKAHDSHPATSKLSFDILAEAARSSRGAPQGTLGIVYGRQAGADLVAHSAIRAVGFTGSLSGGKALLDIISRRDNPIPFYGELSSLNPVIITPAAATERAEGIAAGLVASFTLGAGQLCTKPGLVLVPNNPDGDRLIGSLRSALAEVSAQTLLNERIYTTYTEETTQLRHHRDVTTFEAAHGDHPTGFFVDALVFETDITHLDGDLINEIFGPVTVIVRYDAAQPEAAAARTLQTLPHSLTATIHHGSGETDLTGRLTAVARPAAGRIVYNGFPTGVAVSWAQTHGGPWPSTNSLHTSVGATAIRRFLRPLTYQDAPESVLPKELRDDYDRIPRRINGRLRSPGAR